MPTPAREKTALPLPFYEGRADGVRTATNEAIQQKQSFGIGLTTLGLFACIALYESLVAKNFPLWTVLLPAPFAAYLLLQSRRLQNKILRLFRLGEYYEAGIARLTRNWESLDEGREFSDPDHFYAADLDLFGHGSLFQLICSARTQAGRETLANWMKAPCRGEEAVARQDAISELRERHDLRDALAVAGAIKATDCRPGTFRAWASESSPPFPSWRRAVAFVLPFSFLAFPLLYWFRRIDGPTLLQSLILVCLLQAGYAAASFRHTRSISDGVGPISVELPIVSEIFHIIEHEHFSSAKLVALAGRVRQASPPVRRLKWLIRLLKQRDDAYFTAESYLLLWGTQFTMAIDHWRRRYGAAMLDWLAAVGEFEALISLSAYAYEHPADTFPEMLASGPALDAQGMAHPLLDENIAVRNDVQLGRETQLLIVSGSNMSGKSTFIRAMGLNAVLAWMGAPVRCAKLRISPVTIGAAIRIQDSLVDGQSHFLAEMKRLRRMIDIAGSEPLLYLADEIMSGTNSHDRRIATEWVIRALVLRHAIGVITTHDLALTEIASTGLAGQNVYFEDSGEGGNLHFDYKLHRGLLTHSNALNIAHMLGIDTAATGIAGPDGKKIKSVGGAS
jgi:hypothetical protein